MLNKLARGDYAVFTGQSMPLLLTLGVITVLYVLTSEVVKKAFYRRLLHQPQYVSQVTPVN